MFVSAELLLDWQKKNLYFCNDVQGNDGIPSYDREKNERSEQLARSNGR
jgi:hypothetical protein